MECRTLPQCNRGKGSVKGNKLNCAAMSLDCFCVCKKKATPTECNGSNCPHGEFFHLQCLNYKRRPNNRVNWKCNRCKTGTEIKTTMILSSSSKPICPISSTVRNHQSALETPQTHSAAPKLQSFKVDNGSDSDINDGSCSGDVEFVKKAFAKTNKYAALSALRNTDYELILSPTGWLT